MLIRVLHQMKVSPLLWLLFERNLTSLNIAAEYKRLYLNYCNIMVPTCKVQSTEQ